ncbi:MAG: ABC transporter ATP-binding protein [Christensenella sp.]|uniref:ABC transporter ATP-binding protein n=1 Tax=Christensenella sp. TaxID=1935934 RepID=UPI002B1F151C|nr:ABC transporter ATP-binding protein [Christensenella sp.]MEA5003338.1 ABC transporter ATP-binding protein [Christensenella sp.]
MIKILKNLTTKEWGFIGVSVVLIVFQVRLDLTLPEYMGKITELVQMPGSQMNEILAAGGSMLLITVGSAAVSIAIAWFAARIASNLSARLRTKLFQKVQSFTMEEVGHFTIPSLITRTTNDITQIQNFVVIGLQIIIKTPILVVWAIIKIMSKSWQWSLSAGVAVGALVLLAGVLIALVIPKFKMLQQQTDDINRVSREHLTGIRVVRAYNAEKYQEKKFEKKNETLTRTNMFANRAMAVMMPGVELIMNGLTLSVYWIGAALITAAAVTQRLTLFSDMMVFSSYAIQLLMAFMMLVVVLTLLPRASVSASRVNEVLGTEPVIKDGYISESKNGMSGEIEFRNVNFKYPDADDYVLENLSFQAKKGETVAFIGSTGCGKSTVINLIPRFYDVTGGEVLVDGINVKDYAQSVLRNKIGYVSQKAVLFQGSVSSNVSFGSNGSKDIPKETVVAAIATAQSTDFVENMENDYEGYIAPGGTNLSGGQKQRLSIARAIAREPEILIFDDSFSALDYKTDRQLRSDLKKSAKGATVLIVAQRIGTIKDADKIIVLENGRIAGMGVHRELMKTCEVYREIAYSQLSKEELENE